MAFCWKGCRGALAVVCKLGNSSVGLEAFVIQREKARGLSSWARASKWDEYQGKWPVPVKDCYLLHAIIMNVNLTTKLHSCNFSVTAYLASIMQEKFRSIIFSLWFIPNLEPPVFLLICVFYKQRSCKPNFRWAGADVSKIEVVQMRFSPDALDSHSCVRVGWRTCFRHSQGNNRPITTLWTGQQRIQ